MPGNEMYCHACHHQWRRESDAIECPACRSASTEIVREFPQGMPDARTLLTDEQITPENDPRQFHAQPAETIPAANVSAPAEPHPADPQPAANTTPSDVDQNMRDAPANEAESNPSNPSNDAAGSRSAHNGQGQHPEYIFVLPPPMVTFFTTVVTDTHVPPPNTAGPRGPPVTTHFSMNFFPPPIRHHTPTGVNSPPTGAETPAAQQNATDGPQPTARPQHTDSSLSWLELFLGPMLGIPPSASFGDAVFSQEALDRIITRLREQSGPGGAPPASQAAIDKLEVKELDEKMLGGETKTRCVVCVDEMSVGDKASVLPCSHFFHGECVTPWLKQHNTCPVCRRSIEPEAVKPTKAAEFANDAHQEHQHEHATDAQGCS